MDTADNRGLDDKTNTICLQVPNPIFSGGSNCYSTRQAGNRLERACYELDRIANTIITMLEQYHRMHSTSYQHRAIRPCARTYPTPQRWRKPCARA